jgi:uncharacterized integral membrane protein
MKFALYALPFLGFLIVLLAIVAIVSAQNPSVIVLQFLNLRSIALPLGFWLLFSFLGGMVTGLWLWFVRTL